MLGVLLDAAMPLVLYLAGRDIVINMMQDRTRFAQLQDIDHLTTK